MSERRLRVYMMDLLATVPYYTAYLSRALLQHGVDVRVGAITYYLDRDCFQSRGIRLQPGCVDVVGRFAGLPRSVRRVAKLVETLFNLAVLSVRFLVSPPDVLHVQFLPMLRSRFPADFWFMQLARWRGTKVVLTVHDLLPHDTAERYRDLFRRLYGQVDQIICHSDHVAKRLEEEFGINPDSTHVIPHGPFFYDLPEGEDSDALRNRSGIAPGQQIVLWQGIIFPYKGLDLLLEAWASVEARCEDATLLVVGTGSAELTHAIRAQAERLGLKRVVLDLRFTSTQELVALYRVASIVIYPYRAITTSGALATGVALGKAIIASDLPAFRELLADGADALLVPPADVPALSHALVRLLSDESLRKRLETATREKDFGARSWLEIAARTEAVYVKATGPSHAVHEASSSILKR